MPRGTRPLLLLATVLLVVAYATRGAGAPVQRVLFVGDSITANTAVPPRLTYPEIVSRRLGILAQNLGSPGAGMLDIPSPILTWPGYASERSLVSAVAGYFGPAAVVIALGTNDWNHGFAAADFEAAYREFIAAVPPNVGAIVCVTPLWRRSDGTRNTAGDTLDDYRAAVERACADHLVVDGRAAVPADEAYFFDGLHPNAMGNRRLATAVTAVLRDVLESRGM